MKLFCLSGLGVDERAYVNFHPDGVELVHIPWIDPLKGESLPAYARRLFETVDWPDEFALLGVSFGGMIAVEFAQIKQPKHVFIVSSARNRKDLPWQFRLGKYIPLHRLLPTKGMISGNRIVRFLFGVKKSDESRMLKRILAQTDPHFLRWAMHAIVLWEGPKINHVKRIHGSSDRMIPAKGKVDHLIDKGGHFMIVNRAKEIEKAVKIHMGV